MNIPLSTPIEEPIPEGASENVQCGSITRSVEELIPDDDSGKVKCGSRAYYGKGNAVPMQVPRLLDVPASMHGLPGYKFWNNTRRSIADDWIASFPQARISGSDFAVSLDAGQIYIAESISKFLRSSYRPPSVTSVRALPGEFMRLGYTNHRNYYHWHANFLPNIFMAKKLAMKNVQYLYSSLNNWQMASLGYLGIKRHALKQIPADEAVDVSVVHIGSAEGRNVLRSSAVVLDCATEIAHRVRKTADPVKRFPEKVYISRLDSNRRVCLNEIQLAAYLEDQGYVVMTPSKYSYEQQILMVKNAKIIIGVHGAGLTNQIFAGPECVVVEIFPQEYLNGVYFGICQLTGQPYLAFAHSTYTSPNKKRGQPAEWTVDLDRFKAFMEQNLI